MLKFNNNNIFTGYLKQLLASFNLPKYRIYTKENKIYHDWAVAEHARLEMLKIKDTAKYPPLEQNIIETELVDIDNDTNIDFCRYALYLKDGKIQRYVNKNWETIPTNYFVNKPELNKSKTLKIQNNIYDSYTHEYLGEFLRFIRDYYNINFMPLYNCFSNTICSNLYLKINNGHQTIIFNTRDTNYKIYMLPVKLFKKYTIAIDSSVPIDMCCGLYGAYQDERIELKYISDLTYFRLNNTKFNKPFVYDKLLSTTIDSSSIKNLHLAQNEENLKLFIRVPAWNTSSITILEGDYNGYNNSILQFDENIKKWIKFDNHVVNNYEKNTTSIPFKNRILNPITNLQLLMLNTGESYPFADRLIEYLVGNAITSQDEIADNIKRVQTVLSQWNIISPVYGMWDDKLQYLIYDYMNAKIKNQEIAHDTLGYIDKDVEKYFIGKNTDINGKPISMSNINIYPDLYKGDY